nr:putative nicotine oxidoreductase [Dermacentor andersoni]
MPHNMFGFRERLSTQDVLLQLKMQVIDPLNKRSRRAIFALDLKGTFDNVKHSKILENLRKTQCGGRTFEFIRDLLLDRQAHVNIGDFRSQPLPMGTRGTPQGAVLSPLLFNIDLINLPEELDRIEAIRHALYADEIRVSVTKGSLGQMENALQEAASTVQKYADEGGLCFSREKSALLIMLRREDEAPVKIRVHNTAIPEVETVRILGLLVNNKGVNAAMITQRRTS